MKARIIAATHEDIAGLVWQGTFREDLYYLLAVSRLLIPPLRERKDDLPLLLNAIFAKVSRKLNSCVRGLETRAINLLMDYSWPGNVRELENVMTSAVAFSSGTVLGVWDFTPHLGGVAGTERDEVSQITLAEAEKRHLKVSLDRFGWNISRTSKALDISPTTLRKKISDYGLRPRRRQVDSS